MKLLIRQKNENELEKVKLNLIQLTKEKNDFYDSYLIIFEPLIKRADESLEEIKKEKKEELNKIDYFIVMSKKVVRELLKK